MNKKILIISSLLMALSVFSISCAKSVAAPEVIEKEVSEEEIMKVLDTIGKIEVNNSSRGSQIFDFSKVSEPGGTSIQGANGTSGGKVKPADLVKQLEAKLIAFNSQPLGFTFKLSESWKNTLPTEDGSTTSFVYSFQVEAKIGSILPPNVNWISFNIAPSPNGWEIGGAAAF